MCLRGLRKLLVPQLKRQVAASPTKQQLRVRTPATLAYTRASTTFLRSYAKNCTFPVHLVTGERSGCTHCMQPFPLCRIPTSSSGPATI